MTLQKNMIDEKQFFSRIIAHHKIHPKTMALLRGSTKRQFVSLSTFFEVYV
jgi:hypothetical protein